MDAYALIAESMPRFDRFSEAFRGDPCFLHVLSFRYEDILEFHRRAYKFFRRKGERVRLGACMFNADRHTKAGKYSLTLPGEISTVGLRQYLGALKGTATSWTERHPRLILWKQKNGGEKSRRNQSNEIMSDHTSSGGTRWRGLRPPSIRRM